MPGDDHVRGAEGADGARPCDGDAKQTLLPYVTPAGVFRERRATAVTRLSGCFVIDVDHLATTREAEELRDDIGHDRRLAHLLTFVSPSGRGVKALIPWQPWRGDGWRGDEERPFGDTPVPCDPTPEHLEDWARSVREAMMYVAWTYGIGDGAAGVDNACKDVSRVCSLCHDPAAVADNIGK